jgi:DNA-binding transcriptional ArsR family regulator
METRRDVFQAIADPTRRAIILLLTIGAMTPNAIAEHFNISRQAISRHLHVLAECEVVTPSQEGRAIHYHLNTAKVQEIEQWLEQFKQSLACRFDELDLVLAQLKSNKK